MATSAGRLDLDIKDIAKEYTITVHLRRVKQWRWRLAVGSWLMSFVAWLMWLDEIELKEED